MTAGPAPPISAQQLTTHSTELKLGICRRIRALQHRFAEHCPQGTLSGQRRGGNIRQIHPEIRRLLRSVSRRLFGLFATLALFFVASTALAQVNAKTAVAMIQQAAKAYELGDFVKAADYYGKAWRLDPLPAYLWALARAEHLGARFDSAAEHYRDFVALPGADPARVAKARQYLTEAEAELIKTQLREADAALRSDKPSLAAQLYLAAAKIVPSRCDLLFKAAVAEQMAEQLQSALQHQEEYLGRAPADAPDRAQAIARQGWLRQKLGLPPVTARTPVAIEPDAALPPKPPAQVLPVGAVDVGNTGQAAGNTPLGIDKPAEASAWPGWSLVGGGVALLGGGIALLVTGRADAVAVNLAQQHAPGELIGGLTYDQAAAQVSSANLRMGAGLAWQARVSRRLASALGFCCATTPTASSCFRQPRAPSGWCNFDEETCRPRSHCRTRRLRPTGTSRPVCLRCGRC